MQPMQLESNGYLGIHLDSDTYAPGDTITGYVYRERPFSNPNAKVLCCLHGKSSASIRGTVISSSFDLLSCQGYPDVLYNGSLCIPSRYSKRWPFSLEIPTHADSTLNEGNTYATFTPVGATDHQLPPTYELCSPTGLSVFVEYFVVAKLIFDGVEHKEMLEATHPFRLVHYSPNPPIEDFAVRVCRYPRSTKSILLIPGIQEERRSLFTWNKRSLTRPDGPTFTYELIFGFPTKIQMDNPTPIPLHLVVIPNKEKTTEIIRNVPQVFKLLSIELQLVTCTKITTRWGREKCFTRAVDLGLSTAIDRLQNEILIPCVDRWDPVDVGEMINLRIGLKGLGFYSGCTDEECTPSFCTYNMRVTHKLKWKIQAKVADETISAKGEANVLLLRSSDQRRHRTRGQGVNAMGGALDTVSEVEGDDSWIMPPPEEDAPPSFADAIVMDRIVQPR